MPVSSRSWSPVNGVDTAGSPRRPGWRAPPSRSTEPSARDLALWSPLFRRDPFATTRRLAFSAFLWDYPTFYRVYGAVLSATRDQAAAGIPGAEIHLDLLHAAGISLRMPGCLRHEELHLLWEGLISPISRGVAVRFVRDLFGGRTPEAAERLYGHGLRRTHDPNLALAVAQRVSEAGGRKFTPPRPPLAKGPVTWLSGLVRDQQT